MEDIDVNFEQLNRNQLLQKYKNAIRQLRSFADLELSVRPLFFDSYVMQQYFQRQSEVNGVRSSPFVQPLSYLKLEVWHHLLDRRRKIFFWVFYLLLAALSVYAYNHDNARGAAGRKLQSIAYPSMRLWRRLTLPFIKRFPRLTEYYDESCLMGNPFFELDDVSCSPCSGVEGVLDLSHEGSGNGDNHMMHEESDMRIVYTDDIPYVLKYKQSPIEINDFYQIYTHNFEIFQRDAYRVQSTSRDVQNLEDLFHQFNSSSKGNDYTERIDSNSDLNRAKASPIEAHNLWRCNRMLPARLLRTLFTRPLRLPSTGLALERYVAVDTPQAPVYAMPQTECNKAFVQQALGTRFIILRPTSECRQRCRTLSIRLKESHVLTYNWLYWKPISAPDPIAETISISLIGSYC